MFLFIIISIVFLLILDHCFVDGPAEALVDLDTLTLCIHTWPFDVGPGLIDDLLIAHNLD